jgi:hypothetical protein
VRLERLIIDSGEHTLATDFHPKLTVIGGLDSASREALAGEVIDSLAGARPGIHLELESGGRSLTVFRPAAGRHRVVDTDSVSDVTEEYLGSDGSIDLFAALGVDRTLARNTMRLTRDDLTLRGATDELVARLSAVDQDELWDAAGALKSSDEVLSRVSADTGASATDVALVDAVEEKHAALVAATESYERVRLISLTIADVGAIAGLFQLSSEGFAAALPFFLLALTGIVLGLYYRASVRSAKTAERRVLSATGAEDYASFHLERVSALLDSDNERRKFMQAVGEHRQAAERWTTLAGDISLSFALQHQTKIRAAAQLHHGVGAMQLLSGEAPHVSADVTAELAQALLNRIEAVRALTGGDETLPLVVDDPFGGLEPTMKPMLLEMLSATAGSPQLVVLTADEDVTSWARIESLTGELAVVEPTLQRTVTHA